MLTLEIGLLLAVLILFFGIPIAIRQIDYPATVELRREKLESMPAELRQRLNDEEAELQRLGFSPGECFAVPEITNPNFSRVFHGRGGDMAIVSLITHPEQRVSQFYREFLTVFDSGLHLITKSSASFDMFAPPPGFLIQSYYRRKNSLVLFQRHESVRITLVARGERPRSLPPSGAVTYYETLQNNLLAYQVDRGVLRSNESGDKLKATYRMVMSILGHALSPADPDIRWQVKAMTLGIGGLAMVMLTAASGGFTQSTAPGGIPTPIMVVSLAIGCGLLVGRMFRRKAVLWSAISATLPAFYVALTNPLSFPVMLDFLFLFCCSGWLGSRLHYYREMEREIHNLIPPLVVVTLVVMMILFG